MITIFFSRLHHPHVLLSRTINDSWTNAPNILIQNFCHRLTILKVNYIWKHIFIQRLVTFGTKNLVKLKSCHLTIKDLLHRIFAMRAYGKYPLTFINSDLAIYFVYSHRNHQTDISFGRMAKSFKTKDRQQYMVFEYAFNQSNIVSPKTHFITLTELIYGKCRNPKCPQSRKITQLIERLHSVAFK